MKKLFDFSVGMVFCALISFGVLLAFFFFHYRQGSGILYGILFLLTIAAFVWLVIHFVFRAATMEEGGVRYGRLFIPRENLRVRAEYSERFRESVYYLQDSRTNYSVLSQKEADKARIRVQATRGSRKKLEAYTGLELIPEGKPGRKRRSRF